MAVALVLLTLVGTAIVGAPIARAAAALDCSGVYAIQGTGTRSIWQLNTASGAQTSVGSFSIPSNTTSNLNGLGISNNGELVYGVLPAVTPSTARSIYLHTRSTEVTTLLGAGTAGSPVTHGAVNPQNGFYYYGGFNGSTVQIYGFNTQTNTSIGLVAQGAIPTGGGNGDWAFDQQGRLYVVGGASGSNIVSVVDQAIPTTTQTTPLAVTGTRLTTINSATDQAINGIAFASDGFLYLGSGQTLYRADPVTGATTTQGNFALTGSVDFASCASPSTLVVRASFPNGRVAPSDQVTVSVAGGGLTTNTTGTTQGTEVGVQDQQPSEYAGPVFVRSGSVYTISQSGAGATTPGYISTWQCINANSGATVATGTGNSGSFTMPSGGSTGVAIVCTFSNVAQIPAITLVKSGTTPTDNTPGSTITYSFLVTNTGNVPLASVAVSDLRVGTVTCPSGTLAVGASRTCTAAPYVLTQTDVDNGSVNNTATATGTPVTAGLPTVTAQSSLSTPVAQTPGLSLTKTADTPTDANASGLVDAGDTVGYTFAVTNNGNATLTGLTILDPQVGAITCVATTLAPGASTTCAADARYTITTGDQGAGQVVNTARARGTTQTGIVVQSNQATTTTLVATPAPALTIDKRVQTITDTNASGITDAGDTILFGFTVSNTGNVPLSSLAISDPFLTDLGIDTTCTATSLAVGASTTCVATGAYVVTEADETAGAVTNGARATATSPAGAGVVSPLDTEIVPVSTPSPRLTGSKTAGTPVDVDGNGIIDDGDTIAYTFSVRNVGNVPISALAIDDPKLTGGGATISCTPTTLAPNAFATCTSTPYTITTDDVAATAVANTARAVGLDPDSGSVQSDPSSTATPVTGESLILTVTKRGGSPVDVNGSGNVDAGDTILYTFTVTNGGNVTITGIAIDDPMLTDAGIGTTCDTTTLAPGASTNCVANAPYTITVDDEAAGEIDNEAGAVGAGPGGVVVASANRASTRQPGVVAQAPGLVLDKSAADPVDVNSSGLTDAGDTIAYTFTITNTGNVPLTDITITDDLVPEVTCPTTAIGVRGTITCTANYTVTDADEGDPVVNVATVSGNSPGPSSTVVTSSESTTTTPTQVPNPELTLLKEATDPQDVNNSGIQDAGDTIRYTFTVTNSGNVPLRFLGIDDAQLPGISCDATTLPAGSVTVCLADAPYVITDADEAAGSVTNTATAIATDPDDVEVTSNESTVTTEVTGQQLSLDLDKIAGTPEDANGSGITDAGDTILYTFEVTNTSNVPISSLAIDDPMLAGLGTLITCEAPTLPVGGDTTCTAQRPYVITEEDEAAGEVTNAATATATGPDGDPIESNTATTTTTVTAPAPALTIDKEVVQVDDVNSSGLTDAGDRVTYRFMIGNAGNVPVTGISVVDPLLDDITCTSTTVEVGDAVTCEADDPYVVTTLDELAGEVVNIAYATGSDPDGGAVTSPTDTVTVPATVPAPRLDVDKMGDTPVDTQPNGIVDAGDTIGYSFLVTNLGNVPITDLAVSDPMLAAADIAITCPVETLDVEESTTCEATSRYTITQAQEEAQVVSNTATATGQDPDDGAVESDPDTHNQAVTPEAAVLTFDKIAAAPVDENSSGITDAGDTIQYTYRVTNAGNVPIAAIAVADDRLAGIPVTCESSELAVGESMDCEASAPYVITEDDELAGSVINSAFATGLTPDAVTVTSNTDVTTTTPVIAANPAITLLKEAGTPIDTNGSGVVDAGDQITYTFTVRNTGNVPVDDLAIEDPLLADVGADVACLATRLTPGQATFCTATYTITDADVDAGEVVNSAIAQGLDPDDEPVESNFDGTTTEILAVPAIALTKVAQLNDGDGDARGDVGETVVYTFTVRNAGNVTLEDIVVDDPLAGVVVCLTDELAAGASTLCVATVPYEVTQGDVDAGAVVNVATASGTPPAGGDPVISDEARTSTPTDARAAIALEKTSEIVGGATAADVGDVIRYGFVVTNPGTVTLDELDVDDPMLAAAGVQIVCPAGPLAPAGEVTCLADYTVTEADVAAGETLVNEATATAAAPGGAAPVSPTAATATPLVALPGISLTKEAQLDDADGDEFADLGEEISYTFTVSNTGNVPLAGVAVADPLAGSVECEATTLAVGASTAGSATTPYEVTQADVDAGAVVNVATASGTPLPTADPVTSEDARTSTPSDARAAIALEKTSAIVGGAEVAEVGDVIRYDFEVNNAGTVTLVDLVVEDPMLADAGVQVLCPDGPLPPGAEVTCTADYTVTTADVVAGNTLVNVASATACAPVSAPETGRCAEGNSLVRSSEDMTSTPLLEPTNPPTDPTDRPTDRPTDGPTDSPSAPGESPSAGAGMPGTGAGVTGLVAMTLVLIGLGLMAWSLARRHRLVD